MFHDRNTRTPRVNPKVRPDDPEPALSELLDDPVLQALMARDGVGRAELLALIGAARARLGLAEKAPCARSSFEATLFAECAA